MKRLALILPLAALLLSGCKHETKELTTHTISGTLCHIYTFDEPIFDNVDTIGEEISYTAEWPDDGTLTQGALRELQYLCFNDSTTTVDDAATHWLSSDDLFGLDYDDGVHKQNVDSLDATIDYYSYFNMKCTCQQDSTLAVFTVWRESYFFGAAHGMYSNDYLTIDKKTGQAIHITDLVADTNQLCEAIVHAIQDLDVNKETRECLFDEYFEHVPMPYNFTIDSARNSIIVYYGLYEITCYACGIQAVVLPIYWLSKHVALTPYAKRLFGPESFIKE